MDEQDIQQLDNLLLQLGIETRELAQKRDDIKQQIQIFESSIREKKDYIHQTQKSIRNLDGEIQQKQVTVKFIKENTKNLQKTGSLLLQYEKTLEDELEKRQDSYNQDMKIFQERIENYRDVFQQHKDRYYLNPLAQKLLQVQEKNEEIEKRIRVLEGQITEKERELKAALDVEEPVSLSNDAESKGQETEDLETQNNEELDGNEDPEIQAAGEDNMICEFSGTLTEEEQIKTADREGMSEPDTEMFNYSAWQKKDITGDQMNECDKRHSQKVNDQEENIKRSSEFLMETLEEKDGDDVEKTKADSLDDTRSEAGICPPLSPTRMRAVLTTPTFSLNNSPVCSPGRPDLSESKSPAFVFSLNSTPNTPAFSRLACDFDMGSTTEEVSPFTFTSSYFSDKKSPGSGPKFSGFLFDEGENPQEDFSFSFSNDNTEQNSSIQQTEGPDDSFPFTFTFGKI